MGCTQDSQSIALDVSSGVLVADLIVDPDPANLFSVGPNGVKVLSSALGIPTGTILKYGGAAVPTGYLKCDGSAALRSTYNALYGVIGSRYGPGDGATTFNLPGADDPPDRLIARALSASSVTGIVGSAHNGEGNAQSLLASPAASYDGTPVTVRYFAPEVLVTAGPGELALVFVLFRDGSAINQIGHSFLDYGGRGSRIAIDWPPDTPSVGSHVYEVKVFLAGGTTETFGILAGAGGAGAIPNMRLDVLGSHTRIIKT